MRIARKSDNTLLGGCLAVCFTWLAGLVCWLTFNYLAPRWHIQPLTLKEGAAAWFLLLVVRRLFIK
jgi:hypothetical protein